MTIDKFFEVGGLKMKPYCTQNDGDCETCGLVNYGRDCQNKPIIKESGMYWVATEYFSDCCGELLERAWDGSGWVWECSKCDKRAESPVK